MRSVRAFRALALLAAAIPVSTAVAQTLETETARLLPRNGFKIGHNFEYQVSAEGKETALPFILEYGLTGSTEVVIEPVLYTAIRPKGAFGRATGAGDLEITVIQRLFGEASSRPAIAIAGEIKVPTARNQFIGTGKTDYALYLIASRRFGRLDGHANVGYTFVGQPAGVELGNIANFALGGMYDLGPRTKLFGELLGNTAATSGAPESATTPEAAGGELVGTVGIGQMIQRRFFLTLGVSYDNNGAVQVRPGFVVRVH